MISGIKKKFIDILFENDPEQIVEQQPVIEPKKEIQDLGGSFNAKDVLYKKSKSSAFIDLEETIQGAKEEEEPVREYEFSQQISPMFGIMKKEHEKPPVVRQPEKDEKMVNKPEDSHLEIVTSPIYGYGEQHVRHEMPKDSTVEEEDSFSYDKDDPYMKGLYEHPEDPYPLFDDQDEDSDYNMYDDYEDK